MDYPEEFLIEYLVLAVEQKYGVKIELDEELNPNANNISDEILGFCTGFVEGVTF
jgi:hypothetical protein